jgi:hypothetical protein
MNYLYYSKHLHIILAFPSTWYANLEKKGKFNNLESVTKEIKLMMDPMQILTQLRQKEKQKFLLNLGQKIFLI